jgi:hypothetical protein
MGMTSHGRVTWQSTSVAAITSRFLAARLRHGRSRRGAAARDAGDRFLTSYSSDDAFAQYFPPAFHQGLKETGYVDCHVTIEYRRAEGRYDQKRSLPADAVSD